MESDGRGRTRLDYRIPARGLIGFQGEFMNLTRGTGLMSHVFDGYAPVKGDIPERRNGVLVSAGGRRCGRVRAVEAAGARADVRAPRRASCTKAW